MPRGDGTGPTGAGPGTGRGKGRRDGSRIPGIPGKGRRNSGSGGVSPVEDAANETKKSEGGDLNAAR